MGSDKLRGIARRFDGRGAVRGASAGEGANRSRCPPKADDQIGDDKRLRLTAAGRARRPAGGRADLKSSRRDQCVSATAVGGFFRARVA